MIRRPFAGLSDSSLRAKMQSVLTTDRVTTVELLFVLDEIDRRRLYRVDACSSLFRYCVERLEMSEDVAYKRIRAARAARRFPLLFDALADGRLHLAGVVMLAPHLKASNVDDLVAQASHSSKKLIELLLAERFPQKDVATIVRALPAAAPIEMQLAPGPVAPAALEPSGVATPELAPGPVRSPARAVVIAPLAPRRYALQVTIAQETHDRLRRAQELIGFASRDVATVLDRALALLVRDLERKKLAATSRPQARPAPASSARSIPAAVTRAVVARDGGRCAYVGPTGQRCQETRGLEFDHRVPLARGGSSDVFNVRQLCRAHNQLEAERVFGRAFMEDRRGSASPAP